MATYLDYIHGNTSIWNIPWNIIDFEWVRKVKNPEPIEIGIVPIREGIIQKNDVYESLIKPTKPIPPYAENEMNITNEMLEDAPSLAEIRKEVKKIIMQGVFIEDSTNKCDIRCAVKFFLINDNKLYHFSTYSISKLIHPKARNKHALKAICNRWRVVNSNPHRALHDALATAKVFIKMLKVLEENGFSNFTNFQKFYEEGF
ncbi:MAG: 3'-5' exonuclease [Deltaproteobacteria bacterium]|nr:3'-5' exonuclease [Deltaproteobacteria bacterium]